MTWIPAYFQSDLALFIFGQSNYLLEQYFSGMLYAMRMVWKDLNECLSVKILGAA